ncbi:acyltransferase [Paenibacillaceae bacterium]|nr:acyltransferase [Paenibacillaceae bacterium]
MDTAGVSVQKKEKIPELQIVRAMAIIGVLSVHSTSYATVNMTDSSYYFIYNFFNIFMKFGTPTFIFLSSFVLFYNYYSRPLDAKLFGNFYKKRLLYILIPYLLFSVFYFALMHYIYYPTRSLSDTIDSFIDKVSTGKAYTHLYFVYISIQFYILFPLVLLLFKRWKTLSKWAIPIGLALQWGFVLVNKYYLETPVANKGSWSLSYMAYFMLGAFMGIYYPKLKSWIIINRDQVNFPRISAWVTLWIVWLVAGLAHVYVFYLLRLYKISYNTTLYEALWNIHTYACALALLQLANVIYRKAPGGITKLLERLGALSFGIYLIHPFFLFFYREFPPQTGNSMLVHLWYAGGFVTALVCSWIVVSLTMRFVPFSWVIFGNTPSGKRKT